MRLWSRLRGVRLEKSGIMLQAVPRTERAPAYRETKPLPERMAPYHLHGQRIESRRASETRELARRLAHTRSRRASL